MNNVIFNIFHSSEVLKVFGFSLKGAAKYSSMLWVDKYKPKTMKNIVGQQGEKSNANKLREWLINWKSNNNSSKSKRSE